MFIHVMMLENHLNILLFLNTVHLHKHHSHAQKINVMHQYSDEKLAPDILHL